MDIISELPEMSTEYKPSVLLIGNGVSRVLDGKSWDDIIDDCYTSNTNENKPKLDVIKTLLPNMQIVAASNHDVKTEMQNLQTAYLREFNETGKSYFRKILDVPVDTILTTNYDYDFEQTYGVKATKKSFQNVRRWTQYSTGAQRKSNLFQYSDISIDGKEKRIWHIHGDICQRESMIMGFYYYGKLIHSIQDYIPRMMRRYSFAKYNERPFYPKSWVDYFLLGDVYILGQGMNFAETDLWWLIECKQSIKQFKDTTKIYFYERDDETKPNVRVMLETLGVEIVTITDTKDFFDYYLKAKDDICRRIGGI